MLTYVGLILSGHTRRACSAVEAAIAGVAEAVRRRAASCRRVGVVRTARALGGPCGQGPGTHVSTSKQQARSSLGIFHSCVKKQHGVHVPAISYMYYIVLFHDTLPLGHSYVCMERGGGSHGACERIFAVYSTYVHMRVRERE